MGCQPKLTQPQTLNYTSLYGKAMRDSINVSALKSGDGVFAPSCNSHIVQNTIAVNTHQWPAMVADWFFDRGVYADSYRIVEECDASSNGLPCNADSKCRIGS
jgi:hypothetical protein